MIGFADQTQRAAHRSHSTELAGRWGKPALARNGGMVGIKLQVPRDKKVKRAVMIVVTPGRTCRPTPKSYSCLVCNVGERTIAVVVVKAIFPQACDVHVSTPIL